MTRSVKWTLTGTPPEKRLGLHNQVASRIGTLIAEGTLHAGLVIPNESTLGTEFGVSRTVLREAIKVLASKGLVEVRRKTGTRVRPQTDWNILDPEVLGWLFGGAKTSTGLHDLLELRRLIEPAAARMAAERADPEALAKIEKALLEMEAAADDLDASVDADLEFHLAILESAQNAFFRPFGALIQIALRTSFRLTNRDHAAYVRSLKLHRGVFDAIHDRECNLAESLMIKVLDQTSSDLQKRLSDGARSRQSKTK